MRCWRIWSTGLGEARIAALKTSHRFGESIGALATAIRVGDADRVIEVLRAGGEHIEWIDGGRSAGTIAQCACARMRLRCGTAAILGDGVAALATLDEHRLLCAHRRGPFGVQHWNRQVERWLTEATGEPIWSSWYAGRPVLVTANDYGLGLYNGDTGVTVVDGEDAAGGRRQVPARRRRSRRAGWPTSRPCTR